MDKAKIYSNEHASLACLISALDESKFRGLHREFVRGFAPARRAPALTEIIALHLMTFLSTHPCQNE
jgi:hypothetical protein